MATFLQAIAREEGWLVPNSLCRRNNNPGNIENGRFALAHGAVAHNTGRFAIFPTPDAGFAAMQALLGGPSYAGLTVAEAIARWAPSTENDTASYISNVCLWADCQPSQFIAPLVAKGWREQ